MREICFNLWYWLDARQRIIAIAAKAYLLAGAESKKGATLAELSAQDYRAVAAIPLEEPIHYSELHRLGIEALYGPLFELIRDDLKTELPFPEDKFFYATPLYDFGEGYVPALIGNGVITERP